MTSSKIVIDMAGAMEKMTPEMMDHTRDLMIAALTESGAAMRDSLLSVVAMCEDGRSLSDIALRAKEGLPK